MQSANKTLKEILRAENPTNQLNKTGGKQALSYFAKNSCKSLYALTLQTLAQKDPAFRNVFNDFEAEMKEQVQNGSACACMKKRYQQQEPQTALQKVTYFLKNELSYIQAQIRKDFRV